MRGRSLPVSIPRRIGTDYVRLSATIPSIPIERTMELGAVAAARNASRRARRESLCSARLSPLRRKSCQSSGAFFSDLAQMIRDAKAAPLDQIKDFRRVLVLAKLPGPLRRLLWWLGFSIGRQRGNYFGTFAVLTVSAFGAELIRPIAVSPMFLTYGMIGADQRCPVRLMFDHRVVDGVPVARALVRLEAILNTTIVEELRTLAAAAAPIPAAGMEPASYLVKLPAEENSPP